MHLLAHRFIESLSSEGILEKERKAEYEYALTTFIEKYLSYLLILIAAVFFQRVLETIIFLVTFVGLRKRTGGYHMNTYWGCLISSSLITISAAIGLPAIVIKNWIFYLYAIFCFASFAIVCIYAARQCEVRLGLSKKEYRANCKSMEIQSSTGSDGYRWWFYRCSNSVRI